MSVLRQLDLVVLALALPLFLLAGWPIGGWIAGGGIWIAQRAVQSFVVHRASASDDLRTRVGLIAGSMIGRGWLVAITILAVGLLVSHATGLAAAVLFLALFTVQFSVTMILRPFDTMPREPSA